MTSAGKRRGSILSTPEPTCGRWQLLMMTDGVHSVDVCMCLCVQVVWVQQQVAKKRVKRNIPLQFTDPKWPRMWYLVSKCVCVCVNCLLVCWNWTPVGSSETDKHFSFYNPKKAHPCAIPRLLSHCASKFVQGSLLYVGPRTQKVIFHPLAQKSPVNGFLPNLEQTFLSWT